MRKRIKRLLGPIPTKVVYLWEKAQHQIRRIEIFSGQDKPEIPQDVDKLPEIPQAGGWAKKAHERHLNKGERNKHHG